MTTLLAVDPGLIHPAAALFEDGVLVRASRVKVPAKLSKLDLGQRCLEVANLINSWLGSDLELPTAHPTELVIEWPKVYRGNKSKGDPADLFGLVGVGMCLAGVLQVPTTAVQPWQWIGNLPKTTKGNPLTSIRGQRIWSRLSEVEKQAVVLSHDAIDAVGIGLWKLGRLERRQSFIGASQ